MKNSICLHMDIYYIQDTSETGIKYKVLSEGINIFNAPDWAFDLYNNFITDQERECLFIDQMGQHYLISVEFGQVFFYSVIILNIRELRKYFIGHFTHTTTTSLEKIS